MHTDDAAVTAAEFRSIGTASYSPDDNKLRLYPFARLDSATYERVSKAGFSWAPRQKLFVAPSWSPEREDLLIELCGEVGDEDTSLVDRAEDRADRFEGYSDKRLGDAHAARDAVSRLADNIPLGQPILVGHHSEKRARKDAERIRNGMRKAVRMWETSTYWQRRAKGALAHAKYKEQPAVRARRIKGLESDLRKFKKNTEESVAFIAAWRREELTLEQAKTIASHDRVGGCKGGWSLWAELDDGKATVAEAAAHAIGVHERGNAVRARWITHTENRLAYEHAMLNESGGLAADKYDIQPGGRVQLSGFQAGWYVVQRVTRKDGRIVSVSIIREYCRVVGVEEVVGYEPPSAAAAEAIAKANKLPPLVNYPGEGFRHMTAAEFDRAKRYSDFYHVKKLAPTASHGAHRLRHAPPEIGKHYNTVGVYLTDAKRVDPPAPAAAVAEAPREVLAPKVEPHQPRPAKRPDPEAETFQAMRESLRTGGGVQAVSVPQLFVTPGELARETVELADVAGRTVLEPSAGTGNLARECVAQGAASVRCIDIASACVQALQAIDGLTVKRADFLDCMPGEGEQVERIVMNPPFADGADVRHVTHAFTYWLAPGGRLVAIMSAGVRYRSDKATVAFRTLVEQHGGEIEDLPEDSFKASGTSVPTVRVVIEKPASEAGSAS